ANGTPGPTSECLGHCLSDPAPARAFVLPGCHMCVCMFRCHGRQVGRTLKPALQVRSEGWTNRTPWQGWARLNPIQGGESKKGRSPEHFRGSAFPCFPHFTCWGSGFHRFYCPYCPHFLAPFKGALTPKWLLRYLASPSSRHRRLMTLFLWK